MTDIEWRIVPSYPQLMASNTGMFRRVSTGFVSPGTKGSGGYRYIKVNKRTSRLAHRLVAEAFLGPPPFAAAIVRHLDGIEDNNVITNLAYGSLKDNKDDSRRLGEIPRGEQIQWCKLTASIVVALRAAYNSGSNLRMLCRDMNVPYAAAYNAVRGKTWRHVSGPITDRLEGQKCRGPGCHNIGQKRSGLCRHHMIIVNNARRSGADPDWLIPNIRPQVQIIVEKAASKVSQRRR